MNLEELLKFEPQLHFYQGKNTSFRLVDNVLQFLDDRLNGSHVTLETGSGVSTVLFAMKQTQHICITPDQDEVSRIQSFCQEKEISTENINFIIDKSEMALPFLDVELDLVLIDGRHGFPAPFIDWYYTTLMLKIDGILIVDDTQLWTGDVLKKFLLCESDWQLIADYSPRSAIFAKHGNSSHEKEWNEQAYVLFNSDYPKQFKPL